LGNRFRFCANADSCAKPTHANVGIIERREANGQARVSSGDDGSGLLWKMARVTHFFKSVKAAQASDDTMLLFENSLLNPAARKPPREQPFIFQACLAIADCGARL
jgi:hypothetical protein